ncbi:hypothetical protein Elgi_67330 [Paenibacillus elgii]|uniref:hypothetical protein n=1 Tax=Paenibacillus elgii TaxID=189691 RepID=UPI002D7CECEC|nr:hypothetical protein Elgi_67330 [Paenibacillus elgii]
MAMLNKMQLMLHVAFFPFKDLLYVRNDELVETALHVHHQNKKSNVRIKAFLDKLYPSLLSVCAPASLDEINLLLEKFHPYLFQPYFPSACSSAEEMECLLYDHYFLLIHQFTRALLSHRDGEMVLKYWNHELGPEDGQLADVWQSYNELDKVHLFSILSRLIPLDLFVAYYYASNCLYAPLQLDGLYQHINLADAPLHDVLRNGVAENHMHASAAFTFTMLWQSCMNFNGDFSRHSIGLYLKQFKASYSCKSDQIKEYILTAQLIRHVLARYIATDSSMQVSKWIRENLRRHAPVIQDLIANDTRFATVEELKQGLEVIKKEFVGDDHTYGVDWIFSIFREYRHINTYGENIFLHQVMMHKAKLTEAGGTTAMSEFLSLFFRYLRIKNEFYQQVNQSNAVKGLDYFRSYFDRATSGFNSQDVRYFQDMLRNLFQNQYLKKVELRLSIANRESTNRKNILRVLQAYKQILFEDYQIEQNSEAGFPRIGIVYHLIKQKDDIDKDWRQYQRDTSRLEFLHYGQIQQQYMDKVHMLLRLRNRIPYLSNFIVGLDAASLENNTPIQVFGPVFEAARNSDNDQMLMVDRNGHKTRQQSLFFTFHAGEDFRHLASGLRRIDEVMDYCKLHSGDRIGHGIALGMSVDQWVRENGQVILPRGEYLDNLLWTWGIYTRSSDINSKTYAYLQHKINEVAGSILKDSFEYHISIEMLYEVYRRRFRPIKDLFKGSSSDSIANAGGRRGNRYLQFLTRMYHDKTYLERLAAPIYVKTTDIEKEILMDMQRYVRDKIALNGIVVEINPTSNFVIGDMKSFNDNQFFQIQEQSSPNAPNALISVNTDDPIVFNTNISNEFAYLYYGMLYRGISRSEALRWIEYIRKSGMDTSFIRDNVSNYEYLRQLDCVLAALQDPYYCEEG